MRKILAILLLTTLCTLALAGCEVPVPDQAGEDSTVYITADPDLPTPELVASTYVYVEVTYKDGQTEMLVTEEPTQPWDLYLTCTDAVSSLHIVGYAFFNESDSVNFYYRTPDGQVDYDNVTSRRINKDDKEVSDDVEADFIVRFDLTVPTDVLMIGENEIALHADAVGHALDGWVMFDRIQIEMSADPSTTQES